MGQWLSSYVKEQPEVREALSDLADKIREYKDAAKPTACRETGGSFLSPELTLFRPGWKLFTVIIVVYGIAGIIFSLFVPSYDKAGEWTDLALRITVPVFVIGISLVAIARSISESKKFAGEYLNDSCRTSLFCCLTMVAVLCGLVGYFVETIENIPNVVIVGICMASVGAAINCLAMLAFVVRETIRCSVPSKSTGVVLRYAARKLTWGYLKEAYVTFFRRQQKDYLEKWCIGKTIYSPEHYYGRYFRSSLHSGNGDNDVEIELDRNISGQDVYKDYNLNDLEELDKYLKENSAELSLSCSDYEGERNILGILSGENVKQNKRLQSKVLKIGRKAIRQQKYKFLEEGAEFWESHLSPLETALGAAIKSGEPNQVSRYLVVALKPLSALRALRRHKVIADSGNSINWRDYEFIRFYLKSLKVILEIGESDHVFELARVVRKSVWEETNNILREMDYHSMKLYTWLVQQMYTLIQDSGDKAKNIKEMRGQFGGFYEFADGWLEENESKDAEDVNKMRLVLHKGLTKWLLAAIQKKDGELIEQLCNVGRKIVFGCKGIKFDNKEIVLQHFVLAGHLINLTKSKKVNTTAVKKLFCDEPHSHESNVNFDELVGFYLDVSLPAKILDSYLTIFYSPTQVHKNLFTGSSSSFGCGSGPPDMSLAFTFLASHALASINPLPGPIAGMSGKITDGNIETIKEVFKDTLLNYGLDQLEKWIQTCDELNEAEEDKEIADSEIDEAKAKEHERKFWDGYSRAIPVLSMCLKNGNYEIDNNVKNECQYNLPKIALFDWKYPLSGAEGDRYGLPIGRKMERKLLDAIIEGDNAKLETKGHMPEAIDEAVKWLEKEGCDNDKGYVLVASKKSPEIEMFKNENFVPSWREKVKSMGFTGFYQGIRILWLREENEDDGEENGIKKENPQCQKVVAVDPRGWIGLRVRKEVVADRRFGELKIRNWTPEEIRQAIESGKLKTKDTDKAKGNCPVDVTFFWESVEGKLPRIRSFKFSV